MALSPLAAVWNKMIIAVTVKAVFLQKKFRDTLNTMLPVPFAQLRAGGPGLVAVHEDLFFVRHCPRKRSASAWYSSSQKSAELMRNERTSLRA